MNPIEGAAGGGPGLNASAGPPAASRPVEVSKLVADFNELIAAYDRELKTTSRLAAIVESSADPIIDTTLTGEVVFWNVAAERLYGYSATEMVGRDVAVLFPPDRKAELSEVLDQVGQRDTIRLVLTERVKKDGTLVPVSMTISPVLSRDGVVVGVSATVRDMTEDVRAAAELSRAHQAAEEALSILETLQRTAPIGFGFMDRDFRILRLNEMLAAINGLPLEEQIGRTTAEVIPALWPQIEPVYRQVLDTGDSVVNVEVSGETTADPGQLHHWLTSYYPVRTGGEIIGIGVVVVDVTEQHQAEVDRLAFADRRRQSERLESLGQLAGGVAHDFNNLLAVIMNYAAFVADETTDRPAVQADVEQIQAAAERAAQLTKQLLIFSQRESTRPESLEFNAIVANCHKLLSRTIGEHIQLRVEAAPNLPAIWADRGQIEQVLLNLVVNARDAMPDGGTLTIQTKLAEIDDDYGQLHPGISPGDYVELAVSDTGSGMSAEVKARIFEPFFTTKPQGQGTGLGLSTVHGIVTEARGGLSVYSEEGLGTTFRLYFPSNDGPATTAPTSADHYTQGNGETVLVVDDEISLLGITTRILTDNGYVAIGAATGEEALAFAAAHDLQLLLTDYVMPHMSGQALAERIKELKPGLAVLFMSGYTGDPLGPQRIADEGLDFIQKPFNRRGLLEKVHAVLSITATLAAGSP